MESRDEMNRAYVVASDFAWEQLSKQQFLAPFAVVLADDKPSFVMLGAEEAAGEGKDVVEALRKLLRAKALKDKFTTVAIASDVRMRLDPNEEPTDALCVQLEHIADIPITCVMPYRRTDDGIEQHLEGMMEQGERTIFLEPSN